MASPAGPSQHSRPTQINVTSERGTYPVLVGAGLIASPQKTLKQFGLPEQALVVSAPGIWKLHGAPWRGVAGKKGPVLISDGEKSKTLATISRLYDAFSENALDRASTVIALGGGTIGDAAGFAAATYLRGLRVIQVPTTLLAQVDSAIGGKTGVNLPSGKNLVGAFHSPAAVLCDPLVLGSLPRREFRSGLYEVVKYGVIASPSLLDTLREQSHAIFSRDVSALTPLIAACCRMKADVVMSDERESGARRALNFGHTIGHALEAITRYRRFRHGEAIGYGMLAAVRISRLRTLMTDDDEETVRETIRSLGPMPAVTDLRIKDALAAMTRDKKIVAGTLHFVAAKGLGATVSIADVTTGELTDALKGIGLR
ncbi:MAG: 3-dehydroquinate synthase [Acidobacteriota bacterium]